MEIHQKSYDLFCNELSEVVQKCFNKPGIRVVIQDTATVVDQEERRAISRDECVAAGLTHCKQVVAQQPKGTAFTLFELPVMQRGVFVIKGKKKIIMLKKRRANVPVRIGDYITVLGGKLDVATGKIIPPGSHAAIPIENVEPWCEDDPGELISYLMEHKFEACWHTNDVAATRVLTPGQLLKTLIRHVLNHCRFVQKKTRVWPHQMASAAIESAMATGNWKGGACGVTQLLNTNNALATSSHFKTVIGCNNDADRYVHPSTWCLFCPSETPEGEKCGLVHHLTQNADVILQETGKKAPKKQENGKFRLFWNGIPHGFVKKAPKNAHCCYRTVREQNEVWAWSDAGHLVHKNAARDPSVHMLGMAASLIPFAQHNQSPRVSYYSAMSKQAMQCGGSGKHRLCYAQQSLVKPFSEAGINVVIAIIPMGWNIEDALVFNKTSLDRGLFRSITSNTYTHTDQKYLAGDIIPEGTMLGGQKLKFDETVTEVLSRADGTFVTTTETVRTPEVGDKFCSRAGQKGTMGIAVPQQDMPFNQDGISPDVVINPHAFPSRMTVSQILETAAGKLRCCGVEVDGTPFRGDFKISDARRMLGERGFDSSGKEVMHCGKTGQPLKAKIFMGLCFYQRLHHMAREKCYSRKGGPVDAITMQPVAGRKVGGGIRLGEMEKDCMNAGGCMSTLQERMQSIGHSSLHVCTHCSLPTHTCSCRTKSSRTLFLPHASKLLIAELQSMLIKVHIT